MNEKFTKSREIIDPQGNVLKAKIGTLKRSIDAIREVVVELHAEQIQASPEHQKKLDQDLERYNQTIRINEANLEQLSRELVSRLDSDTKPN